MEEKIKKIIENTIVDEILLILLGLALLIWPNASLNLVFRAAGIVILIMGALRVVAYVKNKDEDLKKDMIIGIVMLILGLMLIIAPSTLVGIGFVCAAVVIGYGAVVGLIKGIQTVKAGVKGGYSAVIISVIALILAIIILFHPASFAGFIVRLAGIALIVAGISMMVGAYQNNKV